MMPKVSVVIPNYNYSIYLDERIQSLLNQTYKDFELIILDDASTDNSIEVIESYTKDSRIRTKFYSENSGLPYKRWNDGADLAQGEYLLIAGADDSCEPTLLEKLVEKLDNNPSVGLAFSQSLEIDSDGHLIRSLIEWTNDLDQERWKNDYIGEGEKEFKYLLFKNTIPNASCVLMRKDCFVNAGKFDENLKLAADYMLWIKMLMISDIAFIAEPLNFFRNHQRTVRASTRLNGIRLEEILKTKKYLVSIFHEYYSQQEIEAIWESLKEEWFYLLVDSPKKVGLCRNFRIFKELQEVNSNSGRTVFIRLLKHYLSAAKKRCFTRIQYYPE